MLCAESKFNAFRKQIKRHSISTDSHYNRENLLKPQMFLVFETTLITVSS